MTASTVREFVETELYRSTGLSLDDARQRLRDSDECVLLLDGFDEIPAIIAAADPARCNALVAHYSKVIAECCSRTANHTRSAAETHWKIRRAIVTSRMYRGILLHSDDAKSQDISSVEIVPMSKENQTKWVREYAEKVLDLNDNSVHKSLLQDLLSFLFRNKLGSAAENAFSLTLFCSFVFDDKSGLLLDRKGVLLRGDDMSSSDPGSALNMRCALEWYVSRAFGHHEAALSHPARKAAIVLAAYLTGIDFGAGAAGRETVTRCGIVANMSQLEFCMSDVANWEMGVSELYSSKVVLVLWEDGSPVPERENLSRDRAFTVEFLHRRFLEYFAYEACVLVVANPAKYSCSPNPASWIERDLYREVCVLTLQMGASDFKLDCLGNSTSISDPERKWVEKVAAALVRALTLVGIDQLDIRPAVPYSRHVVVECERALSILGILVSGVCGSGFRSLAQGRLFSFLESEFRFQNLQQPSSSVAADASSSAASNFQSFRLVHSSGADGLQSGGSESITATLLGRSEPAGTDAVELEFMKLVETVVKMALHSNDPTLIRSALPCCAIVRPNFWEVELGNASSTRAGTELGKSIDWQRVRLACASLKECAKFNASGGEGRDPAPPFPKDLLYFAVLDDSDGAIDAELRHCHSLKAENPDSKFVNRKLAYLKGFRLFVFMLEVICIFAWTSVWAMFGFNKLATCAWIWATQALLRIIGRNNRHGEPADLRRLREQPWRLPQILKLERRMAKRVWPQACTKNRKAAALVLPLCSGLFSLSFFCSVLLYLGGIKPYLTLRAPLTQFFTDTAIIPTFGGSRTGWCPRDPSMSLPTWAIVFGESATIYNGTLTFVNGSTPFGGFGYSPAPWDPVPVENNQEISLSQTSEFLKFQHLSLSVENAFSLWQLLLVVAVLATLLQLVGPPVVHWLIFDTTWCGAASSSSSGKFLLMALQRPFWGLPIVLFMLSPALVLLVGVMRRFYARPSCAACRGARSTTAPGRVCSPISVGLDGRVVKIRTRSGIHCNFAFFVILTFGTCMGMALLGAKCADIYVA